MLLASFLSVDRFHIVRYIKIGSIQLGPMSIDSTSILSVLDMLGSGRYSTHIPWRSDSEDDASHANRSACAFSSHGIQMTKNPISLLMIFGRRAR